MNSSWAVRVDRKELVEFQVDGTHGSAVAGLFGCRIQPRVRTPKPVWNPDLPTDQDFRASGTRSRTTRSSATVSAPSGSSSCRRRRRPPAPLRLHVGGPRPASWSRPGCTSSAQGRRIELGGHSSDRTIVTDRSSCPTADGAWRTVTLRRAGDWADHPGGFATREVFAAAHVAADPFGRQRTGGTGGGRLGRHAGVPPRAVPLRLRRRRGDGHRAAQHGPGLAGGAGAGPPQRDTGRRPRRPDRVRCRHRPPRRRSTPSTR